MSKYTKKRQKGQRKGLQNALLCTYLCTFCSPMNTFLSAYKYNFVRYELFFPNWEENVSCLGNNFFIVMQQIFVTLKGCYFYP